MFDTFGEGIFVSLENIFVFKYLQAIFHLVFAWNIYLYIFLGIHTVQKVPKYSWMQHCCWFLVHDLSNFWFSPLDTFKKVKNHKLIIIGFWFISVGWKIEKGLDWEPSSSNHSNFPQNYCLCLSISISWPSLMS